MKKDNIFHIQLFENYLKPQPNKTLQSFKRKKKSQHLEIKNKILNFNKNEEHSENVFVSYVNLASVHGVRNLIKGNLCERIFWILIFIFSTVCSLHVLIQEITEAKNGRSEIFMENLVYPVGLTPFPALTVCLSNQISKSKASQLAKKFLGKESTEENVNELMDDFRLAIWQEMPHIKYENRKFDRLQELLDVKNYTIENLLMELVPECENIVLLCKNQGHVKPCYRQYKKIYTHMGLCCALGMMTKYDYEQTIVHDSNPLLYYKSISPKLAYNFLLYANKSDIIVSQGRVSDFKIFIHDFRTLASTLDVPIYLKSNYLRRIQLRYSSIEPSANLLTLPVEKRKCYDIKERELDWYTQFLYTRRNCLNECFTRLYSKLCGCVLPYSIRPDNVRVCRLDKKYRDCILKTREIDLDAFKKYVKGFDCKCLPLCQVITITLASDIIPLNITNFNSNDIFEKSITSDEYSLIQMHLTSFVMDRSVKDVYRTSTTILADLGGIAGFFLGFSLLCLVEWFTFFILYLLKKIYKMFTINENLNHIARKFLNFKLAGKN